jgi:hypothetical protein
VAEIFARYEGQEYSFLSPTEDDVEYIASHLRKGDQGELYATTGHRRYLDSLRLSVASSDDAVVAISAHGEPLALFGVGMLSLLYNTGCPWMLCTPRAMRHRRAFIWQARQYTEAMLEHYDALVNHVDQRNTVSVAWLQRIGFRMEEPKPYGALGLPFHEFRIER